MAIDISEKPVQKRLATASGTIYLSAESIDRILTKKVQKGDPIENAKYAAVHAVKKTPELVFMAHPIPIEGVKTDLSIDPEQKSITMTVTVTTIGKTGAEIDAVLGVMNGLLAILDMVKMYEKDSSGNYSHNTRIDDVYVVSKEKI